MRKSTANLRYIIACLALALIVLLPVITIKLVPVSLPLTAAHLAPAPALTVLPAGEMTEPDTIVIAKPYQPKSVTVLPALPLKQRAADTLEPALPYIVSGWLIGVFGLSIWHLGGWTQLQRLKRRMVKQVDSTLLNKLKVLTQKLKVKQTVRLMESALVQIPTVVGWLRPVILLPASAITGLNSEQLEAIIAHELAHIKRLDYLINILQTVVEILGFYHPAVWWVSHKIRAERENCCDDIAVSISGDRVSYAGALASMEEIRAAHGKLAVAATGGNLFRRICRLLSKDSTDNTSLSWVPAVTAILLIIALAIPTTLALTNKPDSMLTEIKTEVPVEDDIQIATATFEESPIENIPPIPVLATSPAPSDKDQAHVRIDCYVVEVLQDSTIDAETLAEAKKLLGNKISPREKKIDVIMRAAIGAMNASKDKSVENMRLTQDQYNAFIEMLASKGYIKILMNPVIETINGKTATIRSASSLEKFSLEITPSVLADGNIILEVEADLSSQDIPVLGESAPVSLRQLSSKVCVSPGESMIIGGLTENPPAPGDIASNTVKQAKEVLFILIPTIVNTDNDSEKKAESTHKLKLLGLAVAMYADDHDEILPHTLKEVKPYIRDEDVFDWILDNVEYFDKGKTAQRNAAYIPIAYDKTLLEKADGTNILSLDFSVRFVEAKEFEKLDIKRAEILIETWFLAVNKDFIENINHNAAPEEAKELLKLKSELFAAVDGSNKSTFIPPERYVSLLLKAVRVHKDSKAVATPQVICQEDKTADIRIFKSINFISGYTEPNRPSEKPQPKFDKIEDGISLSVKPKLTPNKNIDMEFELEITQILNFEERMYKGKYPYQLPAVQRKVQSTRYIAEDGQTLLFGGHKIASQQDGQTEQKDLLILIKAHAIDSSKPDMPVLAEKPAVIEPTRTTSKVIIPTATTPRRRVRPDDSELRKIEPVTERRRRPARLIDDSLAKVDNKKQAVQIFPLKHHDISQMVRIVSPLLTKTGHVSPDERTNTLIISDTAENLTRIEKIIEQFDVSVAEQTVQKSFKLKYRTPSQMGQILSPLLTKTGHVSADESSRILLVIDTPENLKRIEKIIAAFDVLQAERTIQKFFRLKYYSPSQMAQILIPLITETGYISADENTGNLLVIDTVENLKRIELIITEYDVPQADETVTEIFEIRNGDPVEIVELLKKLINGRHDTTSVIKPDTASVIESSNGPIVLVPEPKRKWIIAKASPENINQIGQWIKKLDTDKSTMGLDPMDKAVYEQLEMIVDLSDLTLGTSFGEVIEMLKNSVEPPVQIQPIWKDLLENAEVEQATPAGMDPLPHIKLRKALEILIASITSSQLGELAKPTYIVDEGVILIGTVGMLPQKKVHRVNDISDVVETAAAKASPENIKQIVQSIDKQATRNNIGINPIDKAVYEQLETIVDLSDLNQGTSFGEVIEKLENSVEPPLQIQPIWKDLLDNAEVEQATPASMDPLTGIRLSKALEILIASVTSSQPGEFGELTYIVDDGVILIGSEDLLPHKMLHCVYDISDLVEDAADANNLIRSITETIEPESWYKLSDTGEGTIMAYPLRQPKNFAVMQTYKILQQIQRFLDDTRSSRREREKTTLTIKPQEMQIIRQQYINNDTTVKSLSEKITKAETGLIEARQKFTQSHPEVRKKAMLLRALKNALQERKKEVDKSFDDTMTEEIHKTNQEKINTLLNELRKATEPEPQPSQVQEKILTLLDESEEPMTPLQQIQKQLDELIKQRKASKVTEPNLSPSPKVKLISNTFIDCPLRDALKSIAAAADVTIIPDENVKGLVTCTLKDVTVETALDILLAGTPYLWKKTPHYYLVASGLELSKMVHRVYDISDLVSEPANYRMLGSRSMKISGMGGDMMGGMGGGMKGGMGGMGSMMGDQGRYMRAQSLVQLIQETIEPDSWLDFSDTGEGTIMAYPKQSPRKLAVMQTYEVHQEIFKLLNSRRESLENQVSISVETVFLPVSEDYLKAVGLDANPEDFSDAWRGHLAAKYPAGPNGQPYGLFIDDLHVTFLLRAVQAHHDSKAIIAPRVHTRAGTTAEMRCTTEQYRYIKGYTEPNRPSDKPEPELDKVEIGTRIWFTPKLTDNKRNINLDLNLEMRQLEGIIEGKYKGKYPYYKPIIDVISAKMPCTIPDGKTMLIGGLKIIEPIIKEPGAPGLKDLPLIGAAFRSNDKIKDQKMLLILVKPVINPEQKATKILPGQKDSEEHIIRLAEQLDKKINPPGKHNMQ
ncbi:MAG: secretin N-terminal domain-containing protein [Planctomycetota bacterium]